MSRITWQYAIRFRWSLVFMNGNALLGHLGIVMIVLEILKIPDTKNHTKVVDANSTLYKIKSFLLRSSTNEKKSFVKFTESIYGYCFF